MYIVLYEPEIPQNTGNIIRLCANIGCKLILIEPLGFRITDKNLRRCGLDYHDKALIISCSSWDDFSKKYPGANIYALTTKAEQSYVECEYSEDVFLLFGSETKGLPDFVLKDIEIKMLRIPMISTSRCLNLANSVAIVAYEVKRQQGFKSMF